MSIRYFICPTYIKDIHGKKSPLYVLFVLRKVIVNKVFYMSYLY